MYKDYCTLFDTNYLNRGLAMIESLQNHLKNARVFVFAFDDNCYKVLQDLHKENVVVISLKEFENDKLKEVKSSRTRGEYCWTCTPWIIKYILETYKTESCIYVDADLYFYNNPSILIDEMLQANKQVLITPHRYTPRYDQSKTSGIYCVQYIVFLNTPASMWLLEYWCKLCLEWCYARCENGKFGDQKYLDIWAERFKIVFVSENIYGGIAPWNIQQYDQNVLRQCIYYHFHNLKYIDSHKVDLGNYTLRGVDIDMIYKPYIQELDKISRLTNIPNNDNVEIQALWKNPLRYIKRVLNKNYNVYNLESLGL